ncbi:MAG: divalent-cation tolerance protein CutA [Rhodospirillales bacterium]
MSAHALLFVYVTVPTREDGVKIARAVVHEKLAACANLSGPVTSVYRWQGAVQEDEEWALILKTASDRLDALTARIKALHSYDCPCVVSWTLGGGNPDFLNWIGEQTRV